MDYQISQIAERIRGIRTLLEFSPEEMADYLGISVDDYLDSENGNKDFSFTFLYKCSQKFSIDIAELITGDMPKLSFYTVVKKGDGLPIKRRDGFEYQHLGYLLKNRIAEPFIVRAKFNEEEQNKPISFSTHKGQEFDYILEGSLKVQLESHTEILNAGDSVFYDSSHKHGMIAINGNDCLFLAIVIKNSSDSEV